MKDTFDLELFWSLPRITGNMHWNGKFCAMGAALHAAGVPEHNFFKKLKEWVHTYLREKITF